MANGRIVKADSLADIAKRFELPDKALSETVSKHIEILKENKTPVQQELTPEMLSLAEGPYYGIAQWPSVHHTCGGLRINVQAQVLDIWGNPISKLYAAGEVTGGVQGNNRLGSNATLSCLVFGRIAGTNAAKERVSLFQANADTDLG